MTSTVLSASLALLLATDPAPAGSVPATAAPATSPRTLPASGGAGAGDKPAPAPPEPPSFLAPPAWRAARWGMTPAEVVAAFPGEAFLQTPPLALPDGNVVGAGIDGQTWEGLKVNVRFVFSNGRLALVSLRTEQNRYVDAETYAALCDRLRAHWGAPLEESKDDAFVDMRQVRWTRGPDRVDVKYIPGVIAVVHYPTPAP
ncbi:MAG TPA: hypothetical protein VFM53_10525 [Anaeromyxobacteraceae bacterium]|nr:hypothetical protein [Anaeromyxobacteraceae bacterium]